MNVYHMFNMCSITDHNIDSLKEWITTAPILALPDNSWPFQIEADSLDFATRAILSQQSPEDNKWHRIVFLPNPFLWWSRITKSMTRRCWQSWEHWRSGGVTISSLTRAIPFLLFTITSWTTCHEHMFIYFYFLPCITCMLHASDACLSFLVLRITSLLLYQTHAEHALTMRYMHVLLYIYLS